MNVDLTVAIPTYNGAKRLPEVLEQLRVPNQTAANNFSWEVIVIDNNSTDDTAAVIQAYQNNWSKQYPLKYYFEPKQGAAFARRRAFEEANGRLVGFLDDDNIPAANWLEAAYAFAVNHPKAGAYGSQIQGVFEVAPPANFQRIAPFLAITQKGLEPLLYEPQKKVLPPSAGLVVRKQAWLDVPSHLILTGRTPTSMVTSEDLEMLAHIQAHGWEIWYNPEMKIDHKIPHWRLQRQYLIPFFQGIGLSRHVTRMLSVKRGQRQVATVAYLTNDLRKIAFHLLKHGTNVQSDLIAACEMQLFISSLISPFYLWKNGYYNRKN